MNRGVVQAFNRAAPNYQAHAGLQEQTALWLLEHIPHADSLYKHLLDIGCGTGWLIQQAMKTPIAQQFTGVDVCSNMIGQAQRQNTLANWLCADMHALPFKKHCADLIAANLSVQWADDIKQLSRELLRVLDNRGDLLFTVPIEGSLGEIETAWQAAGSSKKHVNSFLTLDDWVKKCSTENEHLEIKALQKTFTRWFETPKAALQSLKHVGANRLLNQTQKGLMGKQLYFTMLAAYEVFEQNGHYPLTYEIGLIHISKT